MKVKVNVNVGEAICLVRGVLREVVTVTVMVMVMVKRPPRTGVRGISRRGVRRPKG